MVQNGLWMEMFEGLPELKTLRVMSLLKGRAYELLLPLTAIIRPGAICPKLETLELFDIVPADREFVSRLYSVILHRGARSSGGPGMLKTVELFNAGDLKRFIGEDLRLSDGYEVEMLQE